MLNVFRAVMPKEDRFFDLFGRHSQVLIAGAEALNTMLEGGASTRALCRVIGEREEEADGITEEVLVAIRRSFITPFDRGDIKDLINSMDDAIDQMNKTAKAVTLFEVDRFEQSMREMGALIVQAAKLTAEALPLMRSLSREAGRLNGITKQIIRIEGQSDDLQERGLKELFLATRDGNPLGFVVGREIYDHLEKVMDRFEDVANEISGIVIEHV